MKCPSCGKTVTKETLHNRETKEIGCHIICKNCGYAYVNTYESEIEYQNDMHDLLDLLRDNY